MAAHDRVVATDDLRPTPTVNAACERCGTVPDREWRWCPDCGGRLTATRTAA